MDLSPLIFVALAVAWAVYLVPQALKHHDEVVRSRSVDRFSHTMRVLARREPVSRTSPAGVHAARTVIWFWVRVPVLSEQTTVVLPRVSTAGRRRTTARRRAILATPETTP